MFLRMKQSLAMKKSKCMISKEDLAQPAPVGCTSVREFLQEYEQDFNFIVGPYLRKYHCCEGYILRKLIAELEERIKRGFAFLSENQVLFEDLTLFQVVCLTKQSFLVSKYLNGGVKVNQAIDAIYHGEYEGCSPLHLALSEFQALEDDHEEKFSTIIELLLRDADVNNKSRCGNTPLHMLFSLEGPLDQRLFDLIVNNGADVDATNERGETAIEVFILASHTLLDIESYIENGGNINYFNSKSNHGCIAMMMIDHRLSVKTISDCPNIMKTDSQKRTALHNVVSFEANRKDARYIEFQQHKLPKLIENFLKMGGDIDCQDNSGQTPLHYAVNFQNRRNVSLLLKFGSDINIINAAGKSVLASSLHLSKSSVTAQQINQSISVLNTLMVHIKNLERKGGFISKHNKNEIIKARKLISIRYGQKSRF